MKPIKERLQEYVDNYNFDDTDQFTKIIAMLFAFQDAHDETKKSLERCQERVHELERLLLDRSMFIRRWAQHLRHGKVEVDVEKNIKLIDEYIYTDNNP